MKNIKDRLLKNIVSLLSIVFLFHSCENAEYKREYYNDGTIHLKYKVAKDMRNGEYIEYFKEGGSVSAISIWKDDTIDGIATYYYKSGELKESCSWVKGRLSGPYQKYYTNGQIEVTGNYNNGKQEGAANYYSLDGHLEAVRKYVILDSGESFLNEVIMFKQNGDTNFSKSNFYDINIKDDTINLGDTFKAQIILKSPYFKKSEMYVYIAIPHDSSQYRRIYSDNSEVLYEYTPIDTGKYSYGGFIEEFVLIDENDSVVEVKQRYMYLYINYYVK